MTLSEVGALIQSTTGLDPKEIGSSAISNAIRRRLLVLGINELPAYENHLRRTAEELTELIEGVVSRETWLFRDIHPFQELARFAHDRYPDGSGMLKVLSVGCSTGEEAYSASMALVDSGFPRSRFQVDGVDLSYYAIERARKGSYREHSFREEEDSFRRRYFERRHGSWDLDAEIHASVGFSQGNILDSTLPCWKSPYDIILCRNLLGQFAPGPRQLALDNLCGWLADDGVVILGKNERIPELDGWFRPIGMSGTCSYGLAAASPA